MTHTVFQIIVGHSVRYVRAASALQARVRAFKAWGATHALVYPVGHHAPDIGAEGYAAACATLDTRADSGRELRAMQSRYVPSRERTAVDKKAQLMLRALGLNN